MLLRLQSALILENAIVQFGLMGLSVSIFVSCGVENGILGLTRAWKEFRPLSYSPSPCHQFNTAGGDWIGVTGNIKWVSQSEARWERIAILGHSHCLMQRKKPRPQAPALAWLSRSSESS